jgi:tagatose 1,6-diphosphate aldolase
VSNLLIRKATVDDAEGKGYVHYQSWIETYSGLFPDEVFSNLSLERSVKLAKDHPENTYVAIMDNKIIGFCCYLESRDEDLKDTGEIIAVYVLKAYQGRGIGSELMEVCYKELSNFSKLSLWVLGCNKKSVAFYEKQRFIADGITKLLHGKEVIRMIKHSQGEERFSFFEFNDLTDGEIKLVIDELIPEDKFKKYVPAYKFNIVIEQSNVTVGFIDIRIGHSHRLYYGGNIGYTVFEDFRGNNYALKACKLIKKVAKKHAMECLYITCNPDNIPSRRTCEKLGLPLKEIVDLPEGNDMYKEGERQKCIYYWEL